MVKNGHGGTPTPEPHSVTIMTSDDEDLEEPSTSIMGSCSLLAVTQQAEEHKGSDQGGCQKRVLSNQGEETHDQGEKEDPEEATS